MVYILLLVLFPSIPAADNHPGKPVEYQQPGDTLYWSPDRQVTWDDFTGTMPGMNAYAAYTHTLITFGYTLTINGDTVQPQFTIRCAFIRSLSWVNRSRPEALSEELLSHEQLHFDIAELTARRLKEELAAKTFYRTSYQTEITALYRKVIEDGDQLQRSYDKETRHGVDKIRQEEWKTEIHRKLTRN